MAANSKREKILVYLKNLIDTNVASVAQVVRTRLAYAELSKFAITELPCVAMVGGLPKPNLRHANNQSPRTTNQDKFQSVLPVTINVYAMANVDPDITISTIADDMWAALHADGTLGKLATGMNVAFSTDPQYWSPFVAFGMTLSIDYIHTTGGI